MLSFSHEAGAEILKSLRAPEFIFPSLLMPSGFYALFAIVLPRSNDNAAYFLATYGVFAVMGPAIFGFGIGVANERERGWLKLKQAMPVSSFEYIAAKLITTVMFATLALLPIYLIAGFLGDVALTRGAWFSLCAIHILSTIPLMLIGLIIGFCLSSGGAVAVANIMFFALSIFGGLWFPVFIFPELMQSIAFFMPSYHLAQLSLSASGSSTVDTVTLNIIVIVLMSIVFLLLAIAVWLRQR